MLNKLRILFILFVSVSITSSNHAFAITNIVDANFSGLTVWNKEGSPYILNDNVYIPDGSQLRIDSGVTVMSASSSDPYSITVDGDLMIAGRSDDPVILDGLGQIYTSGSNIDISNATFNNTGIHLWRSTTTLSDIRVINSNIGITVRGSILNADRIILNNNRIGLASYPILDNPVLMLIKTKIAHANEGELNTDHNIINISNSEIYGNKDYGLLNLAENIVQARNTWWGSSDGPRAALSGSGDRISGLVNFDPWTKKDMASTSECCSNVLFIPGIEASRLYKDSISSKGTTTNNLWEPNRNLDVTKLFLNESGQSIDSSIYTKDIIDLAYSNIFNVKRIYKGFVTMMNGVVAENIINSWTPFPYDWRLSASEIVNSRTKLASTTVSLIDTTISLANSSKTGKVKIVAHSNGGIVAKLLVKELTNLGKANLIDGVVTIGTPELGTPQAIPAILHGYNQSILSGLILSENVARNLSKYSIGAMGLLPSRKFFDFGSPKDVIIDNYSLESRIINSYDKFIDFITNNKFSKKLTSDTDTPILLSSSLINKAEQIHSSIDQWRLPSTTNFISFIGWGLPTTNGVKYERDKHCRQKDITKCDIAYSAILSNAGDGTVVADSKSNLASSTVYINLKNINDDSDQGIEHANILESEEVLSEIKDKITDNESKTSNERYFTSVEPVDNDKWLTVKLYSPVDIHIYDSKGRHTGIVNNPDPSKGIFKYEKGIPRSFYADFGKIKMISVPYNANNEIVLEGSGNGNFTLDAEITQNSIVLASTTFEEIPVTPALNAVLDISTSTDNFKTNTKIIVDNNGDGITEYIIDSEDSMKIKPELRHSHNKYERKITRLTNSKTRRTRGIRLIDSLR